MSSAGRCGGLAALCALAAIVVWMWLAMMFIHELGHVLAAWATGGELVAVELRPGRLSHTLVSSNPHPSVVVWGGFLMGWIVPQTTAPAWRWSAGVIGPVLKAWAAFCLLAGGCYLAIGGGERLTDTGQLAAAGWPLWLLVFVGVVVGVIGYARSRSAWMAIARRLDGRPIGWRVAVAWWAWLAAWWVGQGELNARIAALG